MRCIHIKIIDNSQNEIIRERRETRAEMLEGVNKSDSLLNLIEKRISDLIIKSSVQMTALYNKGFMPGTPEYDREYDIYFELNILRELIYRKEKTYTDSNFTY